MSYKGSALRWMEDLTGLYERSFREEERKEEVLEVFRGLAGMKELRSVEVPDLSWGGTRRGGAA